MAINHRLPPVMKRMRRMHMYAHTMSVRSIIVKKGRRSLPGPFCPRYGICPSSVLDCTMQADSVCRAGTAASHRDRAVRNNR
jgi:hypothetical protein